MGDSGYLSLEIVQAKALGILPPVSLALTSFPTQLLMHLRSRQRAITLLEIFFSNFAWLFMRVDREQAFEELLPMFYPSAILNISHSFTPVSQAIAHPHELALLFSVLGCGPLPAHLQNLK